MKRRILHISAGIFFITTMLLPSCELIDQCGSCELVSVDNDNNITYGAPTYYCGDAYLEKLNSEITYTSDGSYYWNCL